MEGADGVESVLTELRVLESTGRHLEPEPLTGVGGHLLIQLHPRPLVPPRAGLVEEEPGGRADLEQLRRRRQVLPEQVEAAAGLEAPGRPGGAAVLSVVIDEVALVVELLLRPSGQEGEAAAAAAHQRRGREGRVGCRFGAADRAAQGGGDGTVLPR